MTTVQYIYILLAILIWTAGYFHSVKYVLPRWKRTGKFIAYIGISITLLYYFNHYALIFIIGHPLLGIILHIIVCKKHDIDWLTCQPEEKYIALQEEWAKGNFQSIK
jgi:hypothetical protein